MFYLKVKNVFHLCKYSCRKRSVLGSTVDKANKFTPQKGIHKRFKENKRINFCGSAEAPAPVNGLLRNFLPKRKAMKRKESRYNAVNENKSPLLKTPPRPI